MPTDSKTGPKLPVTTRDISADGAFFFTTKLLAVGTQIAVCVVFPSRKGQPVKSEKTGVIFNGQVIRIEVSGMAVCFDRQREIASLTDWEDFLDVAASSRHRRAREVL